MATVKSMGTANLKSAPGRTLANPGPVHVTGIPGTGSRKKMETAGSWSEVTEP